ncbi:MAG: SCP2 sterol-binding domain-containing protein [Eubacterium sp.]|nr:SCP2 sterol-binding domain-containing protein [Eubacterium sp.]
MKVNIYYGGRGLIDDPTLYVLEKITKVLDELRVTVERYNLYEDKRAITVLPKTLKDADGIILAASVEWFGIGGFLQQFLDACWLYGDKDKIARTYMLPVVMATTYGEREAEYSLIRAWEMLGGVPGEGLCAYVDNHVEFETNAQFSLMIEKKAENFYRMISKKAVAFPNSSMEVKKTVLRSSNLSLTPQESEQLSEYVSNDNYVKKQKEDIEELASLFKGMLGEGDEADDYITRLQEHFFPMDGLKAVFRLDLIDENSSLVIEINEDQLNCYRGTVEQADVTAKVKTSVFEEVLNGTKSFQSAFMSGDLSAQGNFKILRNFDTIFRFQNK